MVSARPVFKVRDRDRDWAGTVSTSETETLIHEYSRLRPRPRPGKCVFSRPRPRPGIWWRPRISLISVGTVVCRDGFYHTPTETYMGIFDERLNIRHDANLFLFILR